jgi:tetratricopeptide (TPR) repeat protein
MLRIVVIALVLAVELPRVAAGEENTRELLGRAEAKIQAEQFAAAEAILSEARKLDPSDVEVRYRLAYVRYRQRKLVAARADFAEIVKIAPPAYYSRYFLGRISLLENKAREALKWLEPIVAAGQPVFDAPSQLASAYAAAGMREQAIEALKSGIAGAPWDASLYYRLGRLYSETGRQELAAEAFDNSRRLRSTSREDVETLMAVSQAMGAGNAEEAKRSARILARTDADPNALVALGVIYGTANQPSAALEAFDRAVSRDPGFFQAQYNRGLALLKLNRPAEALDPLSRAIGLMPQSIDGSRAYGLAAVMTHRYSEAVAPLERVWAANRQDNRVAALLATAYLRSGSAKKAVEVLSNDGLRKSEDPAASLLRVEALNAAEDQAGALEAAQEAQKRFPQLPQTNMAVAAQLARLGRYQEARPAFAATLKLAPGYPEAELGFADTLARSGDHAAAVEHYQAAVKNERTSVAARSGLGRSLIALRRFPEARRLLEESVAAYPAETPLRVELSRVYARMGEAALAAEQTKLIEKLRTEGSRP